MGVYRCRRYCRLLAESFPHARGGVPGCRITRLQQNAFSPRTWGCTVHIASARHLWISFPHARGGVPTDTARLAWRDEFSPRTWGCTGPGRGGGGGGGVFPTHVGVYLLFYNQAPPIARFPHARGGVPFTYCSGSKGKQSFPHARGGVPAYALAVGSWLIVFPTHVGVYLPGRSDLDG